MTNPDLISKCSQLLIGRGLTIAFAESATAGRICADFALMEHAGMFLKGGLICYDAVVKETLLGIKPVIVERYTAESAVVTCEMTEGLIKLISADIHVSCTGLTCPGGSETEEKPVGTVFLHATLNSKFLFADKSVFDGSPENIVNLTVEKVASLLLTNLS